jgi:hypothetical protein
VKSEGSVIAMGKEWLCVEVKVWRLVGKDREKRGTVRVMIWVAEEWSIRC